MTHTDQFPYFEQIPGFADYQIDANGDIISIHKGALKRHYNEKGYQQVFLYKNDKRYCIKAHRIVAYLFVENPKGYIEINHKDGNKKNNNYKNLEWCSRAENIRHAINSGLFKDRKGTTTYNSIKVMDKETGIVYNSISDAARKNSLTIKKIYNKIKKGTQFSII